MTDNEIIKALECCYDNNYCDNCPCAEFCDDLQDVCTNALDLINRQKAENKDLAETIHNLMIEKDTLFDKAEELKTEVKRFREESEETEWIRQRLYSYENMFLALGFSLAEVKDIDLKEIQAWKDRMIWHCKRADELLAEIKKLKEENKKAKSEAVKEFAEKMKKYIDVGHLRPPTEICFSELDVVKMIDKTAEEMLGE